MSNKLYLTGLCEPICNPLDDTPIMSQGNVPLTFAALIRMALAPDDVNPQTGKSTLGEEEKYKRAALAVRMKAELETDAGGAKKEIGPKTVELDMSDFELIKRVVGAMASPLVWFPVKNWMEDCKQGSKDWEEKMAKVKDDAVEAADLKDVAPATTKRKSSSK